MTAVRNCDLLSISLKQLKILKSRTIIAPFLTLYHFVLPHRIFVCFEPDFLCALCARCYPHYSATTATESSCCFLTQSGLFSLVFILSHSRHQKNEEQPIGPKSLLTFVKSSPPVPSYWFLAREYCTA